MTSILRFSTYSRFVAASGLTNLADGIATVAWAWLASLLTRDAFLIALVPVFLRLPWFLFAIPAGIVTDRTDRRWLILRMDSLRAGVFAAVAMLIWLELPLDSPTEQGVAEPMLMVAIMASAFLVGIAEVFRDNAAQTMLPAIVHEKNLEQANGMLWSVEMIGNALLGPALGAFLIAASLPLPFAVNAITFAAAVLMLSGFHGPFRPVAQSSTNWRAELKEGIQFLQQAPLLRSLAWLTGFWNLLFNMAIIGLVLHVQENLGLGAIGYGLVLAGGAIGGVIGGLIGGRAVSAIGPGKTAQWALASSAPAFLAMAIAPGPVTLGLVLALFELTGVLWNTVSVSYRQRAIPDALLGRVNSLYRLLAWGMMPIGLIFSGALVNGSELFLPRELALTVPFWAAAAGSVVLTVTGWKILGKGFSSGHS